MTSSKKKVLKKVLWGIVLTIIIYFTVSMIVTKIIYSFVFSRYNAENPQSVLTETAKMLADAKEFSYKCGGHRLWGTLYSNDEGEQGLVVLTPGFKSEVIEYEGVIYAFLQEGFDVFAFNPTGHGKSEGVSAVGFPQIIADLDATLDFVGESFDYSDVFLLGHSWGGYATCCSVNNHKNITAAVAVNGVDSSMDAIMAYSTKYVGDVAYGNYPILSLYQNMVFGSKLSGYSSVDEINASSVPVLIIQSEGDEQIPKDEYSIYSKRSEITSENAEFLLYDQSGKDGHTNILYSESRQPNYEIVKIIADFYKEKSNHKD